MSRSTFVLLGTLTILALVACGGSEEPTTAPMPTATPAPMPTATTVPMPTATTAPMPTATPAPAPASTPTSMADLRARVLNELRPVLEDDVAQLILTSDLGFGNGDVVLRRAIEDDVVEQVRSGMEWDFVPPGDDLAKAVLTARVEVDIRTDPLEALGGLVKIPALAGTISVEQPYIVTLLDGGSIEWERDEDELKISVELKPAQ